VESSGQTDGQTDGRTDESKSIGPYLIGRSKKEQSMFEQTTDLEASDLIFP
jgi:hypothetical protein